VVRKKKRFYLNFYYFFLERSNGTNNWNTFHAAAESVTMLYKGIRESSQLINR
jgi:hypothetical protein